MSSARYDTIVFVCTFALLLGLEWRYHRRRLRVGAVLLALAVLAFYSPNYTTARRRALSTPPADRITWVHAPEEPVSAYESGVYTTIEAVVDAAAFGFGARMAAVGALVWLACSPALRETRPSPGELEPPSIPAPTT
jgi:hypothetical protein